MIYRVLERFLRDYLKSRGFGPTPFKQLILVLWTIFTYKRTTRSILVFAMVTVAMTSVLVRFKLVESLSDADYGYLVSVVAWACLLYSSAYLIYLYLTVLRLNYKTQKLVWQIHSDSTRLVIPIVVGSVLVVLQLISGWFFVLEMAVRYNDIAPASIYTVMLFVGYWAMKLVTHVMEGTLLMSVWPLQKTWLAYATRPTKQYLVQLTSMAYYNSTLNYLLLTLLRNINLPSHLTSFHSAYFFIKLSWLTILSVQVTNKSLLPVTYQPEDEERANGEGGVVWQSIDPHTQMVPGVDKRHVLEGLPENSLVICGTKMRSEMLHGPPPRLTKSPIIRDSFMDESLLHTGYAANMVPKAQHFSSKHKTLLYSKSNNDEHPNEDSVKDKPRLYSLEDPIFTDVHSHKCPPDCGHEIVERDSPGVGILAELRVADDNSVSNSASTLSGYDKQQSLLGNTGSSSRQRTSHRGNQ